MQFKKNILRYLLRHAALPQDSKRDGKHPRLMALDDGSKCLRRLIQTCTPSIAVHAYTQIGAWADAKCAENFSFWEFIPAVGVGLAWSVRASARP